MCRVVAVLNPFFVDELSANRYAVSPISDPTPRKGAPNSRETHRIAGSPLTHTHTTHWCDSALAASSHLICILRAQCCVANRIIKSASADCDYAIRAEGATKTRNAPYSLSVGDPESPFRDVIAWNSSSVVCCAGRKHNP